MNTTSVNNINMEMPTFDAIEKRTYKVEELQDILSISRYGAYQLANSGKFKVLKVGKQLRISKRSFDKWLNDSEV